MTAEGTSTDVLVIGAGQAGLSSAYHLSRSPLRHLVLDAEPAPGGAWQHRWPSLVMGTVNGIRELPGTTPPHADPAEQARIAVPRWFADYERQFDLRVERPVRVLRVEHDGDGLAATTDGGTVRARALINATGTWTRPYVPFVPGAAEFAGRQLHTHDYRGPGEFVGKRVVVIGGGISAVQLLLEIAPVAAAHTWVTRRPPEWREGPFDEAAGRAAVAMVEERVRLGLPPRSVVSVTGLPVTDITRAGIDAGILVARPMFTRIVPDGVMLPDGSFVAADILLWCTGFRPALDHLAPLRLRGPGGGIVMDGTAVAADPRIHLVGYGPSASTIGANRAGRAAVRDLTRWLAHPEDRAANHQQVRPEDRRSRPATDLAVG
ncbi:FAD-dependent oxidoreductase [Nakamurella sp. YIM 132087]|uniref:FAD-dependent oxidoreductase n=1 Tax=Nakamurella alba TaxID=2665158 RepID=A0A7K1FI31_9ACTN|nr:FAD-dependent oxidoreductase [Nakamurella alba]